MKMDSFIKLSATSGVPKDIYLMNNCKCIKYRSDIIILLKCQLAMSARKIIKTKNNWQRIHAQRKFSEKAK